VFGGRFSYQRFDLRNDFHPDIRVAMVCSETVCGMVSTGVNMSVELSARCRVVGSVMGAVGIRTAHSFRETALSRIQAAANARVLAEMHETAHSEASLSGIVLISTVLRERVEIDIHLKKNIRFSPSLNERVLTLAATGSNTSVKSCMRENVHSVINAAILDIITVILPITLPPGAELRIDSGLYNVTLDGASILHLTEIIDGEWVFIDRNTVSIQVDAANGQVDGRLLYTERYL
jgi:hypothetical protein